MGKADEEGWLHTFDTNVTVKSRSNDCTDHGKDVASCLETVLSDSEIAGTDNVLALVSVHEQSVEHVAFLRWVSFLQT